MILPIKTKPLASIHEKPRAFGCPRSGGRKHAGVDLYCKDGDTVIAPEDGWFLSEYPFYLGTWALTFLGYSGKVWRLCEMNSMEKFRTNTATFLGEGTVLGSVKQIGKLHPMLHVEMYKGDLSGPLTLRDAPPFMRRADLIDPTNLIQELIDKLDKSREW